MLTQLDATARRTKWWHTISIVLQLRQATINAGMMHCQATAKGNAYDIFYWIYFMAAKNWWKIASIVRASSNVCMYYVWAK